MLRLSAVPEVVSTGEYRQYRSVWFPNPPFELGFSSVPFGLVKGACEEIHSVFPNLWTPLSTVVKVVKFKSISHYLTYNLTTKLPRLARQRHTVPTDRNGPGRAAAAGGAGRGRLANLRHSVPPDGACDPAAARALRIVPQYPTC